MSILEETLVELEKTQKDFWNVSRATGNFLNMLVKISNSKSVLEVGTSNGYSGLWFLDALKVTKGHLTTIEYYDKRQSVARANYDKCGFDGMYAPLLGSACDIMENFDSDKKFDFVFIDACKKEYVKYFEMIKPHLTPKALIVADNIISHAEKVQDFIDAVDADDDFQYEILEVPGGILVAYRG